MQRYSILCMCLMSQAISCLQLTSPVFKHNGMMSEKYTCDGDDVSPPLEWAAVPSGTKSFALIVDDPDAPKKIWVHWILFNIPPALRALPQNSITGPYMNGSTDFNGVLQYSGPCPPEGTHRYNFTLYALDIMPDEDQRTMPAPLRAGATKRQLLDFMHDHILDSTTLTGRYTRKK